MGDMLKMRTVDFKRLQNSLLEGNSDLSSYSHSFEELLDYLPKQWESKPVIFFNEDFEYGDMSLSWLADVLLSFEMPYEYFFDGDIEAEDVWEFYNPSVSKETKSAIFSKDMSQYLLTKDFLESINHLPMDEFKQAIQDFFNNPFAEYPALDQI